MTSAQPHPLMAVLADGVPLSLLVDLAAPGGPDSARILRHETADMSWLAGLRTATDPSAADLPTSGTAAG